MNPVRYELSAVDAPDVLNDLAQRLGCAAQQDSFEPSVVVDCHALSSLDYASLQNLIRLRGRCVFIGLHKLEACMQRYGISNLAEPLPTYPEQ